MELFSAFVLLHMPAVFLGFCFLFFLVNKLSKSLGGNENKPTFLFPGARSLTLVPDAGGQAPPPWLSPSQHPLGIAEPGAPERLPAPLGVPHGNRARFSVVPGESTGQQHWRQGCPSKPPWNSVCAQVRERYPPRAA